MNCRQFSFPILHSNNTEGEAESVTVLTRIIYRGPPYRKVDKEISNEWLGIPLFIDLDTYIVIIGRVYNTKITWSPNLKKKR
jgi:hypothetical protein